jgi:1-acyl-sn-glycerol-3-phosphate acyltransferase
MSYGESPSNADERARGSLLTRLRSYFVYVPLAYACTAVMGSLSLLSSFFDRDGRMQHWFAQHWARMILKILSVRVRVSGLERIGTAQSAVYAANHLSALDIPVLYACLPFPFRIMAKRELFVYPFLGWHLRRSGQIPVATGDARASLRSLNQASQTLRDGMPLVVFPEGGRSPDGQLQSFMGGAFYAALKAQVPVVPVVITGVRELLPMNSFHALPGRVEMVVCDAVPTDGMTPRDTGKLAAIVRREIGNVLGGPRPRFAEPADSEQVAQ